MYVSLASTCHPYYACVSLLTIAQCSKTNSEAAFYFQSHCVFTKVLNIHTTYIQYGMLHEYLVKMYVYENILEN